MKRIMELIKYFKEFIHIDREFTLLDEFFNFLVEMYKYETCEDIYQLLLHIECYKKYLNIEDEEELSFLKQLKKCLKNLYEKNKGKSSKQLAYEKIKSFIDKRNWNVEILDFR